MNPKSEKDEKALFFHKLYHSILKPKSASPYDRILSIWEIKKDKKENEK